MTALLFSTFSYSSPRHTKTNVCESHKFEFSHVMKKIFNLNSIYSYINILQSSVNLKLHWPKPFIYSCCEAQPFFAHARCKLASCWSLLKGRSRPQRDCLHFPSVWLHNSQNNGCWYFGKLAKWCFWWEQFYLGERVGMFRFSSVAYLSFFLLHFGHSWHFSYFFLENPTLS